MTAAISESAVFRAISDPNRRLILSMLETGEKAVHELLSAFAMSQPALSKHLRVLKQAGLVVPRKVGREHRYSLQAQPLRILAAWVNHYERFWNEKLDDLGQLLDTTP